MNLMEMKEVALPDIKNCYEIICSHHTCPIIILVLDIHLKDLSPIYVFIMLIK